MNKYKTVIVVCSLIALASILFCGFSSQTSQNNTASNAQAISNNYTIVPVKMPTEVFFADEKVPINNFDTYESLDRELLINTYWQSQTLIFIKKAKRYFPVIDSILKAQGVPCDFKYLAVAESGLANVISPSGAAGFWQFLKGTAQDYKLEVNSEVDERYHLEKATLAAAIFLNESYNKYGTWALAAASYNSGRRNLSEQIERQKSHSYYNLVLSDETARYVFRLIALKLILESPENYGFIVSETEKYQPIPYTTVVIDSAINSLPDFANQMGINYKVLKELNPWLRENKLTNKYKKPYEIKIASFKYRSIPLNKKFYPQY